MPAFVGPVKVNTISGAVSFGDSLNVSPKYMSKTYAGSGGYGTGDFHNENNSFSLTHSYDADANDTNNAANI
ncbi:spore germination protein PF [Scopulibacillus daqui]|uniref:Spore germination protein PF n=1 Tax=Scopulibacillus daqui TaxID=1469162 RepID=A0ABS2Q392_9BACL|nr:spore germination protein [Scopulibacillus daqui]MBM7645997.1 spore germination protein PF [Scopulibacillus daqui]